jgi:hypothetical protein
MPEPMSQFPELGFLIEQNNRNQNGNFSGKRRNDHGLRITGEPAKK